MFNKTWFSFTINASKQLWKEIRFNNLLNAHNVTENEILGCSYKKRNRIK